MDRNACLLAQMPVELCLRICVTQRTVGSLETITRWLCQTFRPSAIAFETLQPTPESEAAGLRPPDPWEFAVRCVRASSLAASLGVTPVYAAASIGAVRYSFCPVGRDTLIVSPDGRISACYLPQREWTKRGLDLNVGQLDGIGKMHLDPAAIERVSVLVNLPSPREQNPREAQRQAATLGRLGRRATLGFNLHTAAPDLDFLLLQVERHRLNRSVRLGLAHPCLGEPNHCLRPKEYAEAGRHIAGFVQKAAGHGITVEFDCGFVPCMFPEGFLELPGVDPAAIGPCCGPVPDILPDGSVAPCYPLASA